MAGAKDGQAVVVAIGIHARVPAAPAMAVVAVVARARADPPKADQRRTKDGRRLDRIADGNEQVLD